MAQAPLREKPTTTIFHIQYIDGTALCGGQALFDWEISNCEACKAKLKEKPWKKNVP